MKTNPRMIKLLGSGESSKLRQKTIDIWSEIYSYIEENNQIDHDSCFFIEDLSEQYEVSEKTIKNHLRRMWEKELLDAHEIRRKSDQTQRLFNPLEFIMTPTRFFAYTLKGKQTNFNKRETEK